MERLNPEDMQSLFDRYFDQALDEQGQAQLAEYLRQDTDARERFIQEAVIRRTWQEWAKFETDIQVSEFPLPDEESRRLDEEVWQSILSDSIAALKRAEVESKARAMLDQDQKAQDLQLQSDLGTRDQRKDVLIIIPRTAVWGAIAAALLLATWLVISVTSGPSNQTPNQDIASDSQPTTAPPVPSGQNTTPDEPQPEPQPAPIVEAPPVQRTVATLTAERNAAWEGLDASTSQLDQDKLFVLREGMAEVTFEDGSTVLIEAPATFQATGPNGMRLVEGRLAAHVPPSGQGFKVVTPQMTVIDLGTEFGVEVDRSTGTSVDVFTGRVIAESSSVADTGRLDLAAGQATRADIGGRLSHVSVADSTRYYRDLTTFAAAPQISGQGVYLRSHPKQVAFQSFESTEHIAVFLERHGVAWQRDWALDEVVGAEPVDGLCVDVYLAHFDPVGDVELVRRDVTRDVVLHFDRPIVGLITGADGLYRTDSTLGHPEVSYPTLDFQKSRRQRGIDQKDDSFVIEDAGRTLRLRMTAGANIDQLRVLLQSESQED